MKPTRWSGLVAATVLTGLAAPACLAAAPAAKSPPNNFTADEQTPATMAKPKPAFAGQSDAPARNRRQGLGKLIAARQRAMTN